MNSLHPLVKSRTAHLYSLAVSLVIFLFILSGCKSSKKIGTVEAGSTKAHTAFFESMQEQAFEYNTLSARLNVDLKFSGTNMSSRVDLKMVKDSAFQLSVQPFLGIEVFRAEISTDSVKIIDRINKRYVAENYANLKGQTPIEFNFYNLQALFTNHLFLPGQQDLSPKQFNQFKLTQDGAKAEVRTKDKMGLLYTFIADGEEKLLSTYIAEPSDLYAMQWDYKDFRLAEGQPFPMLMDIEIQANGSSQGGMTLHFSRLQTNVPVNMEFSIPSKYTRITLAQILKSLNNSKK